MSKELVDLVAEHWYEVTVDQLKPGDRVAVAYVDGDVEMRDVQKDSLMIWGNSNVSRRFFMPDPPPPAEEYAPGTLARITCEDGETNNAVRVGGNWAVDEGLPLPCLVIDSRVAHVEVLAYPDGTQSLPEVTEEDTDAALLSWDARRDNGLTDPQAMTLTLEDFAARKFGGQA